MNRADDAVRHAEAILRAACGDRVRTGFPMAALTTFRIGGPAALYLEPESERDLLVVAEAIRRTSLPHVVVGKGSNILVSDRGFPGIVLRLGRGYRWAARVGRHLAAGGAMPLPGLSGVALSHGLSGLEFGVAIPASLGGAVRMNAGAHERTMADVVEAIDVFLLAEGASRTIRGPEAGFAYRRTALPSDAVVTSVRMRLERADPSIIRRRMEEARDWRRRTQPLAEPNCGSVFTNPPGDHAARLVDEAGGKGMSVGGAAVSTKHANFIVVEEGTSAADVVALIRSVQELVLARFGVRLEPEVHLVGDLDLAPR
jgi:UDP-N-acetylmuramate dehydrogenase